MFNLASRKFFLEGRKPVVEVETEYFIVAGDNQFNLFGSMFPFFQFGVHRLSGQTGTTEEWEYFLPSNTASRRTTCYCLLQYGDDLLIGSDGVIGNDSTYNRLIKYDGVTSFSSFSGTTPNNFLEDMVKSGTAAGSTGNLYIGGAFTNIGPYLAKWDGNSWTNISGLNNRPTLLAIDSNENIYAYGFFTTAGGNTVNYIAMWDGSSWNDVGGSTGIARQTVADMVCDGNDDLWVVGSFTSVQGIAANRIAKWDGTSWDTIGTGADDFIGAIHYDSENDDIYIFGNFTSINGTSANRVAKWDGSSWTNMDTTGSLNTDRIMDFGGGELFNLNILKTNSGLFLFARDYPRNHVYIPRYNENTSTWESFTQGNPNSRSGAGLYAAASQDMVEYKGKIYIAGRLDTAGGIAFDSSGEENNIESVGSIAFFNKKNGELNTTEYPNARTHSFRIPSFHWDEIQEKIIATNFNSDHDIYSSFNQYSYWDNDSQEMVGFGNNNGSVTKPVSIGSDLYVAAYGGGFFDLFDRVVKYNFSTDIFTGLGLSRAVNGSVRGVETDGTNLYIGGLFTLVNGDTISANRIAKWDGSGWTANVGGYTGANGDVNFIVHATGDSYSYLYFGGEFTSINGITTRGIAKYDLNTDTWSDVGGGLGNGQINYHGIQWDRENETLYVSGSFTSIGGNTIRHIAKWDGLNWSDVGDWTEYMSEQAESTAFMENLRIYFDNYDEKKLYAFGDFMFSDDNTGKAFVNIAVWDGTSWSPFTRYPNQTGHTGGGVKSTGEFVFPIPLVSNNTVPTN